MMVIDKDLLNELSHNAKQSERIRINFNFHNSVEAPSQRMLNALEPGTVVPVHRHRHTDETYVLLQGRLLVRMYDDAGQVREEVLLDVEAGQYGINIPAGCWHDVVVLNVGTVIFECKDGPYMPLGVDDILALAVS